MRKNTMISDKYVFILSVLCVLTLILLWGSCSTVLQDPITDYIPRLKEYFNRDSTEPDVSDFANEDVTFAFVGPSSEEGNKDRVSTEDKVESGDNPEREGVIPEFTIELGGNKLEDVAAHYGFLLIAATGNEIIGKIKDNRLIPVSENELRSYSQRARDAIGLSGYQTLVRTIGEATGKSINSIRLLYLVPNSVESYFIDIQKQAIRSYGLNNGDVRIMIGRYRTDFSVKVDQIITVNGERIAL